MESDEDDFSVYSPSRRNHTSNSLVCDTCKVKFSTASTLRRHAKNHLAPECRGLDNEEYICYECDKLFYYLRLYKEHVLRYHATGTEESSSISYPASNSPLCPYCHQQFSDANAMKSHRCSRSSPKVERPEDRSAENGQFFQCHVCTRRFSHRNGIISHLRSHEASYRCKTCNRSYSCKSRLLAHRKTHVNGGMDASKARKRVVKRLILRKRATGSEQGAREVNAADRSRQKVVAERAAEERVQEPAWLVQRDSPSESMPADEPQRRRVPESPSSEETTGCGDQEPKSRCAEPVANVSAPSPSASDAGDVVLVSPAGQPVVCVEEDALEATVAKKFACQICSRRFRTEHTMKLHTSTHTSMPQLHCCSLCDYSSESQFAFSLHVLDHYKKKFKCDVCDRSFFTKETMERHVETHQVELAE